MKSTIFWVVKLLSSQTARRFGGAYIASMFKVGEEAKE
jgi:hypothetical protein